MAAVPSYFDRKPTSSNRPGLSHLQQDPSSPHTPQRGFSSTFSSPSLSYRNEEESFVFEFGARHLSAGIAGEACPRCTLNFGPEESRRVGDYRRWLPDYKKVIREQTERDWGWDHELWRMDLRDVNLGLVEDKIERAVREVHTKYFLMDQKPRRLVLVLPSILPHPLLSSVLSTIFLNCQFPSITLFSTPIIHTAAAGCRSGLVVDIGWAETIVTAIYEYREVKQTRSTRATKQVIMHMARLLNHYNDGSCIRTNVEGDKEETYFRADLEILEDVTSRVAWCRQMSTSHPALRGVKERHIDPRSADQQEKQPASPDLNTNIESAAPEAPSQEHRTAPNEDGHITNEDPILNVPSPFSPGQNLEIPFSQLAIPVESTIFATNRPVRELDDHDQPVHLLIFKTLLALLPDVRALCMSRIIITGGSSQIPGLKTRLLEEVSALIAERGWDPVEGKAADERRRRLKEISHNPRTKATTPMTSAGQNTEIPAEPPDPKLAGAAFQPQIYDDIDRKLDQDRMKGTKPVVSGVVRGVESLGAWAGGSLVASLKIKGVVDIDRDTFLQHGLVGARKEAESSTTSHRQSIGPNIARGGIPERPGWTLGAWA